MLFLGFSINVIYAIIINRTCFIYTIFLWLWFHFCQSFYYKSIPGTDNLFTWHWICKLLAKINVTVVLVIGEVTACKWNLVPTICRHWCWGGQWLHSEVFSAPAGLVLRIQTCSKADTTTLSVMIPGSKASSGISVTHSWQTPVTVSSCSAE